MIEEKNKQTIIRILAGIIFAVSILMIFGWIFNVTLLKSVLPQFIPVRFFAAAAFLFTGIILFGLSKNFSEPSLNDTAVLIGSVFAILIMGLMLVSYLLGISLGIENLFIKEADKATVSGIPAIPAMASFILIGIAGFLSFLPLALKLIKAIGIVVGLIGLIAVIGYIINQPFLYYNIKGISLPIALNAAVLLILTGIAFWLVGEKDE